MKKWFFIHKGTKRIFVEAVGVSTLTGKMVFRQLNPIFKGQLMQFRNVWRLGVLLVAAWTMAVPGHAASPKPGGPEAAIRAADQAWLKSFAGKDLEKSIEACAETASVLAPNFGRADGKEAIRKLFTGYFALPEFTVSWQPMQVQVARSGDLGYSCGSYTLSFKGPDGKTIADRGKYATIWRKQADGRWKVVLDAFNSDLPAP